MFDSKSGVSHPTPASKATLINSGGTLARKSSPAAQRIRRGEARTKIRPCAWITQILLWALFALTVYAVTTKLKTPQREDDPFDMDPEPWWEGFIVSRAWAIFLGVFLFLLSLNICCAMVGTTGTSAYLRNICGENEIQDRVQQMRLQRPELQFTAECYHYEERGSGDNKTKVRVVSHRAQEQYVFAGWEDRTAAVEGLHEVQMTKLHLGKQLDFSTPAAQSRYETGFKEFCDGNKTDTHQDFRKVFNVGGFKERMLCVSNGFRTPWMATRAAYALASAMLLNAPYRVWFDLNTGIIRHTVVKRISDDLQEEDDVNEEFQGEGAVFKQPVSVTMDGSMCSTNNCHSNAAECDISGMLTTEKVAKGASPQEAISYLV